MPWKYNITVNIDPHSRNQGIKLYRRFLLALWLLFAKQPAWRSLQHGIPQRPKFLHTLLPCTMSMNINIRVSGHTQPADMVQIASFQSSAAFLCSKPAAKSTGKIKLHQLQCPPLARQHSSLAGQTNQRPGALFSMGGVRWAVDGWVELFAFLPPTSTPPIPQAARLP